MSRSRRHTGVRPKARYRPTAAEFRDHLRAAFPDRPERVERYIKAVQAGEGDGYWSDFKTFEEAEMDFRFFDHERKG